MRLSVLDQSPIPEGSSGADALRNTLDLARLCDALGYHRYWVAEHHGGPMLAGAAPEVLVGAIADATTGIRVGSGGVMLPHYSPLKVAEVFTMLSALHPGRVDLGLGRAAGTDPLTTVALQRDRPFAYGPLGIQPRLTGPGERHPAAAPDDFPQQLAELLGYLGGTLPSEHPFARLSAFLPGRPDGPEPWLLGSSPQSAIWAAQLGLPYAFADFINPGGSEIAALYRANGGTRTAVAGWVICADTDAEAQRLAMSSRMTLRLLRRGELIPVPPPDKALEFLQAESASVDGSLPAGRRGIIGSPSTVRAGLESLADEYGAEEVIVVTITYDHGARRRSYELLASVMDLTPRAAGALYGT